MKKLLIFAVLLGLSGVARAEQGFPLWRSSNVVTANLFNVSLSSFITPSITTMSVVIHKVFVNSAAAGSTLKFFRGNNSTATATLYETIDTSVNREITYDIIFSSGFLYGKSGAADITIQWDYVTNIPRGNWQEGKR